jgi:transcriptional regulator with XRE-family HTH domain
MSRIPPMVSLRTLREAHGLDARQLAERIQEEGVDVHPDHIRNVELGHKGASVKLLAAWARALRIKAVDIRQHDDLADRLSTRRA